MIELERLRRTTPARLGVGRAGCRPCTAALLRFRRDHAAARDAVWSEWSDAFLARLQQLGFLIVCSAAADRHAYILNPPLGRHLALGEADRIRMANGLVSVPAADAGRQTAQDATAATVQLALSDGLSARAGERHCDAVVPRLLDALGRFASLAVPVAVRNGRVAVGDEIAQVAGAMLVVHLIGERPGLATADSLGCYLTYKPGPQTIDADRKCLSNIHAAGLNPAEAAASIAGVSRRIVEAQTSGTGLIL
jgi:ethanolamine ammonia-lyase small subunit